MKTVISGYQTTILLIVVLVATTIFFLPSLLIERAGRDAWISMLIIISYGILLAFFYALLGKRMGRMDLINFSRRVLGKYLAVIPTITIIIALLFLAGLVIRETSEVIINAYMMQTPLWFLNSTLLLTALLLVFYGLEVIARSFEVLFYIYVILYLTPFIFLINELSPDQLYPILNIEIKVLLTAVYPGIIYLSPLFIILILAPQITEKGVVLKPLVKAILISGFLLILPILYSLLIFGPALSSELTIPLVNLNSYIEKFMILERIDPFFVFYWIGGGVFKTAILYYAAAYTAQKLFKLSTFYLFIPLFALPVFFISFNLIEDINKLKIILLKSIPFFLGILVFYPFLLLLISIIRGVNYNEKNS